MSDQESKSFIADARRTQIVDATITTLNEIGYVKASLAQIAKRAKISTALISYHFADKLDLMNHTLTSLLESSQTFVIEHIQTQKTDVARLHTFITSSLDYQSTYPQRFNALLEIIFNARTPENIPYYKLDDGEEDPLLLELQNILSSGQANAVFREFDVHVMANIIQAAIGEYFGNFGLTARMDHTAYADELIRVFDRIVLRDSSNLGTDLASMK